MSFASNPSLLLLSVLLPALLLVNFGYCCLRREWENPCRDCSFPITWFFANWSSFAVTFSSCPRTRWRRSISRNFPSSSVSFHSRQDSRRCSIVRRTPFGANSGKSDSVCGRSFCTKRSAFQFPGAPFCRSAIAKARGLCRSLQCCFEWKSWNSARRVESEWKRSRRRRFCVKRCFSGSWRSRRSLKISWCKPGCLPGFKKGVFLANRIAREWCSKLAKWVCCCTQNRENFSFESFEWSGRARCPRKIRGIFRRKGTDIRWRVRSAIFAIHVRWEQWGRKSRNLTNFFDWRFWRTEPARTGPFALGKSCLKCFLWSICSRCVPCPLRRNRRAIWRISATFLWGFCCTKIGAISSKSGKCSFQRGFRSLFVWNCRWIPAGTFFPAFRRLK